MKPILFEMFGFKVFSYGLMIAIGIIVATLLFTKEAKKRGYDEDKTLNLVIIAVISGVLGGKLLFIITEFKNIVANPEVLLDVGYGFVIYGAIILGALGVYIYCRKNKWNTLEIMDCAVPGLAIAQGFGRIGCFLAGCCYGAETSCAISVTFPENSMAPSGVSLYPTQIYSSIFDFILGLILLNYLRRKPANGKVLALYGVIYSVGRFLIEFLRNDPRGNVLMFSTSQFISIIIFLLSVILFKYLKRKPVNNE